MIPIMITKRYAAWTSVLAAGLLVLLKLVVGLATNSLGILAEAAHSFLDLGAALMTLVAVSISDKPPDESHHYGHGKVEGLSAFLEVLLLLLTCAYIMYEAFERILGKGGHVEVNVFSFAVMVISIVVDYSRSRMLYKVARQTKSQALEADALHFSSDIFSSLVVIVGLVGYRFFHLPLADPLAALVVSVLVIVISIRLAKQTFDVLLDKAPAGLREQVASTVIRLPGIRRINNLRVRTTGAQTFADIRVELVGSLSFEEAHALAEQVEAKVAEIIPGADIIVHADPADGSRDLEWIRKEIGNLLRAHTGFFQGYHNLHIFKHFDQYYVSFHLCMSGQTQLEDAHKVCDHLENEIKRKFKKVKVSIHCEPAKTEA